MANQNANNYITMLASKNIKKLLIVMIMLFSMITVNAQNKIAKTHAGPNGIWVLCGDQLPKEFAYRILRQNGKNDWVKIADLEFPKTKLEIQADILNAQRSARLMSEFLTEVRLNAIWERLTNPVTVNIPVEMQSNYPLLQASGAAFYDATADSTVSYNYKVQMIGKKGETLSEAISNEVAYPGKKPVIELKPFSIKSINGKSFIGEFAIVSKDRMNTFKVFRSYYLRSGFQEIQGEPLYLTRDSIQILQFTDHTVVEKVPYSYVIQPIDAAGNVGRFSEELKAFNVPNKTIVPSVNNFRTTSIEKQKAIKLSWSLKDNKDVISIDIFKGATYDGKYYKIASVSPKDTTYIDTYANPIETYYYSIRLNGVYEKSPPSPRITGVLKASNANYFPPKNLQILQDKNVVRLNWERNEDDTRAYYVFRSLRNSYKMEQIGALIITDSTSVSFTDTLSNSSEASVYAYAVADQNTSYVVSSLSTPVFAHSLGVNALPIPYDLNVLQTTTGQVEVIWPNMKATSKFFQGYRLYRRANSIDGLINEPLKEIAPQILDAGVNKFTDNTIKDGMVYYYSLRTIADDLKTMSSPSLEAGVTIQKTIVNGVANVIVAPSGKAVAINWNNPVGDDIKAIKIIRFTNEKEDGVEIASLSPTINVFSDTNVKKGDTYYYQLQVENKAGEKSKMTDAVGVKIY